MRDNMKILHSFNRMEVALCLSTSAEQPFSHSSLNQKMSKFLYTKGNLFTHRHSTHEEDGCESSSTHRNLDVCSHAASEVKSIIKNHYDIIENSNVNYILSDFQEQNLECYLNIPSNDLETSTDLSFTHKANSYKTHRISNNHVLHYASDSDVLISPSKEDIKDVIESKIYAEGDSQFQKYFQFELDNKTYDTSSDYESKYTLSFMDCKQIHRDKEFSVTQAILDEDNKIERKYMQFPQKKFETIVMNFTIDGNSGNQNLRNHNNNQQISNNDRIQSNSTEERNSQSNNQNYGENSNNAESDTYNKISGTRIETPRGSTNLKNKINNENRINIKYEKQVYSDTQNKNKNNNYLKKDNHVIFDNIKDKRSHARENVNNIKSGKTSVDNETYMQIFEDENGPFKSRVAIIGGNAKEVQAQAMNINKQFAKQISSSEEILGVHTISIISQFRCPNSNKKPHHTVKIESDGVTSTYQQGYSKPNIFEIINTVSNIVTSKIVEETNKMLQKLSIYKHEHSIEQKLKEGKEASPNIINQKYIKSSEIKNLEKLRGHKKSIINGREENLPLGGKRHFEDGIIEPWKKPNATMIDVKEGKKYEPCVYNKHVKHLNKKDSSTIPILNNSQNTQLRPATRGSLSKILEKSNEDIQMITSFEENEKSRIESDMMPRSDVIPTESFNGVQAGMQKSIEKVIPRTNTADLNVGRQDSKNLSVTVFSKERANDKKAEKSHDDNHSSVDRFNYIEIKNKTSLTESPKYKYSKISVSNNDNISYSRNIGIPILSHEVEVNSNLSQHSQSLKIVSHNSLDHSALSRESSKISNTSSCRTPKSHRQTSHYTFKSASLDTNSRQLKQLQNSGTSKQGKKNNKMSSDETPLTPVGGPKVSSESRSSVVANYKNSSTSVSFSGYIPSTSQIYTPQKRPSESVTSHSQKTPPDTILFSDQEHSSQSEAFLKNISEKSVSPSQISPSGSLASLSGKSLSESIASTSQKIPSQPVTLSKKSLLKSVSRSQKSPSESMASFSQKMSAEFVSRESPSSISQRSPAESIASTSQKRPLESIASSPQEIPSGHVSPSQKSSPGSVTLSQINQPGSVSFHSEKNPSGSVVSHSQKSQSRSAMITYEKNPSGSVTSHSQKSQSRSAMITYQKNPLESVASLSQKSQSRSAMITYQKNPSGSVASPSQKSQSRSAMITYQKNPSGSVASHSQKSMSRSAMVTSQKNPSEFIASHSQKSSLRSVVSYSQKSQRSPSESVASCSKRNPLGSISSYSQKNSSRCAVSNSLESPSASVSYSQASGSAASHSQESPSASVSYSQESGFPASHSQGSLSASVSYSQAPGSATSHSEESSLAAFSYSQKHSSEFLASHSQRSPSVPITEISQGPSLSVSEKCTISKQSSESVSVKQMLKLDNSATFDELYSLRKFGQLKESQGKISVTSFHSDELSNCKVTQFHMLSQDKSVIPVHFGYIRNKYPIYLPTMKKLEENQIRITGNPQDDFRNRVMYYHYQNSRINQQIHSPTSPNVETVDKNDNLIAGSNIFPVQPNNTNEYAPYKTSTVRNCTTEVSQEGEEIIEEKRWEWEREGKDGCQENEDIKEKERIEVEDKKYVEEEIKKEDEEQKKEGRTDNTTEIIKIYENYLALYEAQRDKLQMNNNDFSTSMLHNIKSDLQKGNNKLKQASAKHCGLGFYKLTSNGFVFDTCDITKHKKIQQKSISKSLSPKMKLTSIQNLRNGKLISVDSKKEEICITDSDLKEYNSEEKEIDIFSEKSCSKNSNEHTKNVIPNTIYKVQHSHPSVNTSQNSSNLCNTWISNKQIHEVKHSKLTLTDTKPEVKKTINFSNVSSLEQLLEMKNEQECVQLDHMSYDTHQHPQISDFSLNHSISSCDISNVPHKLRNFNSPQFGNIYGDIEFLFKKTNLDDFKNEHGKEILSTSTYNNFTENIFDNSNNIESFPNTFQIYDAFEPHNVSTVITGIKDISSLISTDTNKNKLSYDDANEEIYIDLVSGSSSSIPTMNKEVELNHKYQSKIQTTINRKHNAHIITTDITDFPHCIFDNRLNSNKLNLKTNHKESRIKTKKFDDDSNFTNQQISAYPALQFENKILPDNKNNPVEQLEDSLDISESNFSLESSKEIEESLTEGKKKKFKHLTINIMPLSDSSEIINRQLTEEDSSTFNIESVSKEDLPISEEGKSSEKESKKKYKKCFKKFLGIFKKKKIHKKSASVTFDHELVELHMASRSSSSIASQKFSSEQLIQITPSVEEFRSSSVLTTLPRKSIAVQDLQNAVFSCAPSWPIGTPNDLIMETKSGSFGFVHPADITQTLQRGFRCDHLSLSGDRCFYRHRPIVKHSTKLLTFTGSYLPEHFMTKIGYSNDIAKEHLKDQEFADRLQAAIREAAIWTHKISRGQAGLLVLLAYIIQPKIMKYYLHLVEAITNRRITNSSKLNGFLQMLERIEEGIVRLEDMYGEDVFDGQDEQKSRVEVKLYDIYHHLLVMAGEEARKVGYKRISTRANKFLQYISSVILLKPMLEKHMRLLAHYIGQNLIKSSLQTEAAVIYLSKVDLDPDIEEFEQICGIKHKNK